MCITIILPVSLHGHEAWFLTLMEEHNPSKFKRAIKKFYMLIPFIPQINILISIKNLDYLLFYI